MRSSSKKSAVKPHKPKAAEYTVAADHVNGHKNYVFASYDNPDWARKEADYLFNFPGTMNVRLTGPAYTGPKTLATATDIQLGAWLAAALEDPKVCPTMKFDIENWMDSKEWV